MTYYNAIATIPGSTITYHNINKVQSFIDYMVRERKMSKCFFYRLEKRGDKQGKYSGYWSNAKGLNMQQNS